MRRGKKPIPTRLKVLTGNPGQRALPANEPKPTKAIPDPPDFLCALARAEWDSIAPGLLQIGVLTVVDKLALTGYCQAFADYARARAGLNEQMRMAELEHRHTSGAFLTETIVGGYKKSPLFVAANEAATLALRFAAELGLTPSARTRLEVDLADQQAGDPMKGLLYGS